MNALKVVKAREAIASAVSAFLVDEWNGRDVGVELRLIHEAIDASGVSHWTVPGLSDIIRGVLNEFVAAGWDVELYGNHFVFRLDKGNTEVVGF